MNDKKYLNIASGWLKQTQKGGEYISVAVDKKIKLVAETEDGQKIPVVSFAVFFQEEKKNSKSPDVRVTMSFE